MAKARLELQKLFRRAQESVESYDDHWSEMLSLENDEADRLEEKKKGKQASKQPIYTNRLDRLGENLKKEVRKVNVVKDELTAWIKKNPRSDSDTREEAEEWIKKIVDMIHGFHRSFRETKSRKIANEDVTGEADKVGCTQQSMDAWLESSIASFATQRDSVESEAQDLEAKAKGKREKKQIKDREAVRTGYIDFHRENLEIVLRMLRVERLSPEEVHELTDMVREALTRQGRTPDEGYEEEEMRYEDLLNDYDPCDLEQLESKRKAAQRDAEKRRDRGSGGGDDDSKASERKQHAKARDTEVKFVPAQKAAPAAAAAAAAPPTAAAAAAVEPRKVPATALPPPPMPSPAAANGSASAAAAAAAAAAGGGKGATTRKKEPLKKSTKHPCVYQTGHCAAGDGCQYALYDATVCAMQLRFGACRGSKDGRCIWDHPRNPRPSPAGSGGGGVAVGGASAPLGGGGGGAAAAASQQKGNNNVWGNSSRVLAAIGADAAAEKAKAPAAAAAAAAAGAREDAKRRRQAEAEGKEREKEKAREAREAEEAAACKEREERARRVQQQQQQQQQQEQEEELLLEQQRQQQQQQQQEQQRLREEQQRREAEERAEQEAEAAAAAAAVAAAAAAAAAEVAESRAREALATLRRCDAATPDEAAEEGRWDAPEEASASVSASAVEEPPSSCNSDRSPDGGPPTDLASLLSKPESRGEPVAAAAAAVAASPLLGGVGGFDNQIGSLLSTLWQGDEVAQGGNNGGGGAADSEASSVVNSLHIDAFARGAGGVGVGGGDDGTWGSPPWRGGSLFSAGPKWDPQQPQPQQLSSSPHAPPQVQPPVGRSGGTEGDELAQLRRENEALKRRLKVAEMERERSQGEHSLKEAFRMLQNERTELKQDRDTLRQTVKKLQESLREKEWYSDRKPAGEPFDNSEWSPNGSSGGGGGGGGGADSSTHEEWSDDVATRIQQKVDSATRLLGTIKADLEHGGGGGGGADPRIQREKKAAALAARGGGADRFGRNRKPVYVSMQPRGGYQPELCLDPPQDLATGYPIDPSLQYGFGVMPQVPSHRHFV